MSESTAITTQDYPPFDDDGLAKVRVEIAKISDAYLLSHNVVTMRRLLANIDRLQSEREELTA